ncbi:porin family protein [Aegicerativicinus sediminis]
MKLLTTTLLMVLFTTLSFSQETLWGARAGINISNLDFKPSLGEDPTVRNGFVFGGFMDHNFSDVVSLFVELQFSAEGAKEKDLRLDYIQLPVMLRFAIGNSFKIGVGPQIGTKVWKHEDGIKDFNFSGVGGIEVMITEMLFLDARYSLGLSDILDENPDFEAKNNNIQLGFGLKL